MPRTISANVAVCEGGFVRPGIFVPKNLSALGAIYFAMRVLEYDNGRLRLSAGPEPLSECKDA